MRPLVRALGRERHGTGQVDGKAGRAGRESGNVQAARLSARVTREIRTRLAGGFLNASKSKAVELIVLTSTFFPAMRELNASGSSLWYTRLRKTTFSVTVSVASLSSACQRKYLFC